jgi:hypothetical protein
MLMQWMVLEGDANGVDIVTRLNIEKPNLAIIASQTSVFVWCHFGSKYSCLSRSRWITSTVSGSGDCAYHKDYHFRTKHKPQIHDGEAILVCVIPPAAQKLEDAVQLWSARALGLAGSFQLFH